LQGLRLLGMPLLVLKPLLPRARITAALTIKVEDFPAAQRRMDSQAA
jgi:hypothetical protein